MSKTIKKILVTLVICFFCISSFASCSGGIDTDEAKVLVKDFLAAIAAEDYEKAETLLHPELDIDLKDSFGRIENAKNIDFQQGVTIERYTGFNYTYYSTSIGGSSYEMTMQAKVGNTSVQIEVTVVKNDNGYGISALTVY